MKHEPVMTTATALAAIWGLVLALSAWAGVDVPEPVQAAMIPALLAAGWLTRAYTTPLARPRTNDGTRLVPDPTTPPDQAPGRTPDGVVGGGPV